MHRSTFAAGVLAIALVAAPAFAGVTIWGGYGMGALSENSFQFNETNSHRMGGLSWSREPGGAAIRVIRGTMERTDIPVHGDNDLDYYAIDVTAPQHTRAFPFSIGFGIGRYTQAQAVPISASEFDRRYETAWGVHLALIRQWPLGHRGSLWAEFDAHDVALTRTTVMVTANVGLGWRFSRR